MLWQFFHHYIYPIIHKVIIKINLKIHKRVDSTLYRYIFPCTFFVIFLIGLCYFSNDKWDIIVGIFAGVFFSQIVHLGNEILFL